MYNSIKSKFLPVFLVTLSGVALGQITEVDSLEHDTKAGLHNSLVRVNDDTYALAYRIVVYVGYIKTFTIPADGSNITEVFSLNHDNDRGLHNSLVRVNDDTYALAYRSRISAITTGLIKTFTIPADGLNITQVYSLPFNNQNDGSLNHSLVTGMPLTIFRLPPWSPPAHSTWTPTMTPPTTPVRM